MSNQNKTILAPASLPQEQMLNSNSTITLYAGSAGSGKTYALLLTALKFMQYPKATGVIFRRTSKMITAPGSIWHEAVSMFSEVYGKNLRIRNRETELVFPNGAVLKFSHMQHATNVFDHKGAQYSFVAFDEATDFTEQMVVFLLSRMRNANVSHEPQMFLCTNPDYNSFLRLWIQDFYLDQEGIPIPERSNVERYFTISGNDTLWYDTKKEAEDIHGTGSDSGVRSFRLIKANVRDNIPLLKSNPAYLSNLLSLPRVQQAIMLDGSWFAREEASGHFKREWVEIVKHPDARAVKRVRAWDLAATLPSEINRDPDYTAGALLSINKEKYITIEHIERFRERYAGVEKRIIDTAIADGRDTIISIPVDPGAAGQSYAKGLQQRLASLGFTVRLSKAKSSKLIRFGPFSSLAEAGFVRVVEDEWNKALFEELEIFDGGTKNHDDQVDAISDATRLLNMQQQLPSFSIPDFTTHNPYSHS